MKPDLKAYAVPAFIAISIIFLILFSFTYKKIYGVIKNYEEEKHIERMENQFEVFKDPAMEAGKKFNKIFESYLIISFFICVLFYAKCRPLFKTFFLSLFVAQILYVRIVYEKIEENLVENHTVHYLVCYGLIFVLIYELISVFSEKILKNKYELQALKRFMVDDVENWILSWANWILPIPFAFLAGYFLF
ncbi:hypothetical protein [Treponema zioleckii]|uniref:hypothetical protein n=1 Tax=Treponema zioleckii TaxID=331680 RepID=UPI00168B503C|nr:hypothetical protein [Treponema zioleckii]